MIHENANSYSQTQAHHGVQMFRNDSVDWNYEKATTEKQNVRPNARNPKPQEMKSNAERETKSKKPTRN
jgi:hypothetical protein